MIPNPLESAHIELKALVEQKAQIDLKIEAVKKSITILEPVYGRSVGRIDQSISWESRGRISPNLE